MSAARSFDIAEAEQRLNDGDGSLVQITLDDKQLGDGAFSGLIDALLANPHQIRRAHFSNNSLYDETGVRLARYLAVTTTLHQLDLTANMFSHATYLAIADALHTNTSLATLWLVSPRSPLDDMSSDEPAAALFDANPDVHRAFVEAVRMNPNRPASSSWQLDGTGANSYSLIRQTAEQLGHPTLLSLLLRCVN